MFQRKCYVSNMFGACACAYGNGNPKAYCICNLYIVHINPTCPGGRLPSTSVSDDAVLLTVPEPFLGESASVLL